MSSMNASLREVAELIGTDAAARLLAAFGGTEVYIPSVLNMHAGHHLAQLLGLDAAKLLAERYGVHRGGYRICLPVSRKLKRDLILESDGTNRAVALKVGCTERYVSHVRNAARRA
jgi:hypothetical protein